MPFSHYYGLWKNIPRCLPQIQMALTGRIRSFARKHGANAVLIVDIKRTVAGKARPDQIRNQNGGAWTPDDSSGSSFRHFREDMLDYSKTEGPEKPVYDILIKAKLLRLPAE